MGQQDSDIRVSDAERDAVVRTLGEHASVGRLTLDELEDRSSKALVAKTRGDLDTLLSDLPDPDRTGSEPPERPRRTARWMVSIIGSGSHSPRFHSVGTVNAVSVLDAGEVDLRDAEIEGPELTINVFSLLGSPDIFVPDTIDVDTGGVYILGGIEERGIARKPRPGAPVVRLRVFTLLGGATLYRVPPELRGRTTRHIRRALGHSDHGHTLGPGGPFGPEGPFGPRGPFGGGLFGGFGGDQRDDG